MEAVVAPVVLRCSRDGGCGETRLPSRVMSSIRGIEDAIRPLSVQELIEFRRWFAEFDAAAWDRQLESDAASGQLDALDDEACAIYTTGAAPSRDTPRQPTVTRSPKAR
jgi:hypothetical protein